jgi:hypothetical protein
MERISHFGRLHNGRRKSYSATDESIMKIPDPDSKKEIQQLAQYFKSRIQISLATEEFYRSNKSKSFQDGAHLAIAKVKQSAITLCHTRLLGKPKLEEIEIYGGVILHEIHTVADAETLDKRFNANPTKNKAASAKEPMDEILNLRNGFDYTKQKVSKTVIRYVEDRKRAIEVKSAEIQASNKAKTDMDNAINAFDKTPLTQLEAENAEMKIENFAIHALADIKDPQAQEGV